MRYTVFGCNNPSGEFFLELIAMAPIEIWGRKKPSHLNVRFVKCDLTKGLPLPLDDIKGVVVSFAPIWLLSEFLTRISIEQPEKLRELKGIIAISSSSFLTKRFAFSNYDKGLAFSINKAQEDIIKLSRFLGINCQILAPTLVYGCKNGHRDRNISEIISILRRLPIIVLPKVTGLRQPIHASQLARVAHIKAKKMLSSEWMSTEPYVLPLGGDEILSYTHMLKKIKCSLPYNDRGRRCMIIEIPDRVFLLIVSFILPFNTRLFEAIMRMKSDLAGFSKTSDLIAGQYEDFPVLPLPL
jgi:hypothetical protein